MAVLKIVACCIAGIASVAMSACAQTIPQVNISARMADCEFVHNCKPVVTDSESKFTIVGDTGEGRLVTRTFPGAGSAPGRNLTAYEYRVDLSSISLGGNCVNQLQITFGDPAVLPLLGNGVKLFVVTSVGPGSIGVRQVQTNGPNIYIGFDQPICRGQSSYFVGLGSLSRTPHERKVGAVYLTAGSGAVMKARVP